jgi:simple sugar transport system ATP-binding protein
VSLIDKTSAHIYAEQCVERFRIKCRSVRQEVRELSGGNRQKVCLARALATDPRLLLMAEPTHGVDIEAKEVLLRILLDLNHRFGMTILVASSELDELKRICDRIAVVRQGRVTQVLGPQDEDRRFMLAFSGKIGEPE